MLKDKKAALERLEQIQMLDKSEAFTGRVTSVSSGILGSGHEGDAGGYAARCKAPQKNRR